MKIKRISTHRLRECEISMEKWTHFTKWKASEEWIEDEVFGKKWISPTCVCYNPTDGLVYVGLTALDRDIFYTFDPATDNVVVTELSRGTGPVREQDPPWAWRWTMRGACTRG